MNLLLTDREAGELHDLLERTLPDLRREIARTDKMELRRGLAGRLTLVERLLDELAVPVG